MQESRGAPRRGGETRNRPAAPAVFGLVRSDCPALFVSTGLGGQAQLLAVQRMDRSRHRPPEEEDRRQASPI